MYFKNCVLTETLEDRHKKKQQKEQRSSVDKTNLQRSKTFVNLLFKKERKSPSRRADRGEITATFIVLNPGSVTVTASVIPLLGQCCNRRSKSSTLPS